MNIFNGIINIISSINEMNNPCSHKLLAWLPIDTPKYITKPVRPIEHTANTQHTIRMKRN